MNETHARPLELASATTLSAIYAFEPCLEEEIVVNEG